MRQFHYLFDNNILGAYRSRALNVDELDKIIQKTKTCKVINHEEPGRIGIFSSGSISGNPKLVFVSEQDILINVFKSKFNSRYRKIYNPTPLSSISGLFTNLFLPLVNNDTIAKLSNTFDINEAIECTDVYFRRDILDYLPKEKIIENVKIEKAFIFGDVSNIQDFNAIRKKILLPKNCFVHVYGNTECGGLISEYEEKDFDRIYIYAFDINNDSVVLSQDGVNIYQIKAGKPIYASQKQYENYTPLTLVPCGLVSEGNLRIDNKAIGEGLIKDFHTNDIFIVVKDKIYPLGRKDLLERNHFIANFDADISTKIGNLTCATFADKSNNLHLAIKYPITYNKDDMDYSTRFRNLIDLSKKIDKIVRTSYLFIDEIFFVPDDKFVQSDASKKIVRSQLEKFIDEGRKINENIEHFDENLRMRIYESCQKRLGYIPKYKIINNRNILIDENEISPSDLALLLNDLSIILIQKQYGCYYIYYDDSYFFDENKGRKYSEKVMNTIHEYAKKGLLIEKVAAENKGYTRVMKGTNTGVLKEFSNYTIHLKVHRDYEGNTILIPYYCYAYFINSVEHEIGLNLVNNFTYYKFSGYDFEEEIIEVPLPVGINKDWFTMPIYISNNGDVLIGETEYERDKHKNSEYICNIITKLYDPHQRQFVLGRKK